MRVLKLAVVTALSAGLAPLAPAYAQPATPTYIGTTPQDVGVMDRARPEYDAKGIPMGGFRLFPTLDLGGTYDDNVFRRSAGQSDFFFTIAPALRLRSQWGRHFLEVYAGSSTYQYSDYTRLNLTDWNIGTDGRLDISHAAVASANVYYGEYHELLSSPNTVGSQASPNRYYRTHAELQASYQPNRLGVGMGGSYDRFDWQNTPAIGGGTINNSDRNADEYIAYAKIYYDFSPGYSAFVKASYDDRKFDQKFDRSGLDRSSHGYRVDGGVDMQLTHLLSGEVFVGYLSQDFPQNVPTPLPNVSGFDFGAKLDWYATELLTVHLGAARTLTDVIVAGASVSDDRSVKLSADYEFRRNVIVQAYVGYTNSKLVGIARTDDYPSAGIGVKYLMNRYLSAEAHYDYSERSSSVGGVNFGDNMISIGLTAHI